MEVLLKLLLFTYYHILSTSTEQLCQLPLNALVWVITELYCGMYFPLSYDKYQSFSQIFSRTEFCLRLHTAVVFRMQSFNN